MSKKNYCIDETQNLEKVFQLCKNQIVNFTTIDSFPEWSAAF